MMRSTTLEQQEDYKAKEILYLLKNYSYLQEGLVPAELAVDWGGKIDAGRRFRAPFELSSNLKCDIDMAFSKLPRTEQFVLLAYLITDMGLDWCAYSLRMSVEDVENITENAIQIMYEILNGRKQRRN